MKFNMICIKFDPKFKKTFKKPKFWTFEVLRFLFLKTLKNLGFFEAIFQPWRPQVPRIIFIKPTIRLRKT